MEDVLEVYQRPYDGNEVLVCMDETSKQQVKETRVPRPAAPGLSAAYDYEYERNGVSSLFMLFAPLDGWRRVEVRERRTKVDWAHVIKKGNYIQTYLGTEAAMVDTKDGSRSPIEQAPEAKQLQGTVQLGPITLTLDSEVLDRLETFPPNRILSLEIPHLSVVQSESTESSV